MKTLEQMKTFFKIIIFLVIMISGMIGTILCMKYDQDRLLMFVGTILGAIIYLPAWDFWWDYISKIIDKKDE